MNYQVLIACLFVCSLERHVTRGPPRALHLGSGINRFPCRGTSWTPRFPVAGSPFPSASFPKAAVVLSTRSQRMTAKVQDGRLLPFSRLAFTTPCSSRCLFAVRAPFPRTKTVFWYPHANAGSFQVLQSRSSFSGVHIYVGGLVQFALSPLATLQLSRCLFTIRSSSKLLRSGNCPRYANCPNRLPSPNHFP